LPSFFQTGCDACRILNPARTPVNAGEGGDAAGHKGSSELLSEEQKFLQNMKKHIDRSGIILYTNIRRLDVRHEFPVGSNDDNCNLIMVFNGYQKSFEKPDNRLYG